MFPLLLNMCTGTCQDLTKFAMKKISCMKKEKETERKRKQKGKRKEKRKKKQVKKKERKNVSHGTLT